MNTHEITFNTKLLEAPRTQADFIYKITPTLISITDRLGPTLSGRGLSRRFYKRSSIGIKARSQSSRSCAGTVKVSGTEFDGTARGKELKMSRNHVRDV